jgi:hypothetical protein
LTNVQCASESERVQYGGDDAADDKGDEGEGRCVVGILQLVDLQRGIVPNNVPAFVIEITNEGMKSRPKGQRRLSFVKKTIRRKE